MNFKTLDLAIQFNHHIQHIKVAATEECQVIFMLLKSKNMEVIKLADYLGASIYKLIHSNLSNFE